MVTADVSTRLLEIDFAGIEGLLVGRCLWKHAIDPDGAPQYIRLARNDIHSAVTGMMIGKTVDLTKDDETVRQQLSAIKKAHGFERDLAKRVVHGCVPGDHEVLTPTGWQRIDAIADATPIAQWDNGHLSFVVPSHWTRAPFSGDLITLHGRAVSLQATPNHRVGYWLGSTWHVREAADLPQQGRIPTQGVLDGTERVDVDILRLVAAAQADAACGYGSVVFHLVKPRKIARLQEILQRLGQSVHGVPCRCHSAGWRFRLPYLLAELVQAWLAGPDKILDLAGLLALTPDLRRAFIDELPQWDGSRTKDDETKRQRTEYRTTIAENAVVVQTVAASIGQQALLRTYPIRGRSARPMHIVSFNARQEARLEALERGRRSFDGMVYCPTVPSGFFLIRHNNRISVTGNSNYGLTTYGLVEKFPEFFPNLKAAQKVFDAYHALAPGLPKWHAALRKQARETGFLGGPTLPGAVPSVWDHEYGYRHWFWDVLSYQPCDEFTARKWLKDRSRKDRIVQMHGRWFKVRYGGDSNRCVSFYPQSLGAGRLKEAQTRLFMPWADDYIGDCYFGRTPLLGVIHDSLLLMIPNRCWDRVVEIVARVMQEPSPYLPIPREWGWGPFLPIGVAAKAGKNWAPRVTEDDQIKIRLKSGADVPLNDNGMEDIPIPEWVPNAGSDDLVMPRDEEAAEDWNALKRVVA